jgi:glycosyltransferase involved in cell wall biosynthesis
VRASIVIAVLDSHEIVRRQILHWEKLNLPDDVEILLVDDGSNPPLSIPDGCELKNFRIHATNDFRPWTQPIARNTGVKLARGEYVICTDIDHILTRKLIEEVLQTKDDVVQFKRQVGILDEHGDFDQRVETMKAWGFPQERIDRRGLKIVPHGNSYAMRRELFLKYGGGREDRITTYPNQEEVPLRGKIRRDARRGNITIAAHRPTIYMFPVGRYIGGLDANPFGLFHSLSRIEYLNEFKRGGGVQA